MSIQNRPARTEGNQIKRLDLTGFICYEPNRGKDYNLFMTVKMLNLHGWFCSQYDLFFTIRDFQAKLYTQSATHYYLLYKCVFKLIFQLLPIVVETSDTALANRYRPHAASPVCPRPPYNYNHCMFSSVYIQTKMWCAHLHWWRRNQNHAAQK